MSALLEYRQSRGVTQAQLAEELRVTQGLIAQIENGHRKPGLGRARDWEQITNNALNRYNLRPDVFGPAPERNEEAA